MSRAEASRHWLARQLGCDPAVVDRLAAAQAVAGGLRGSPAQDVHPDVDAFPEGPALRPFLAEAGSPDVEAELSCAVAAGREVLGELVEGHEDADRVLAVLLAGLTRAGPTIAPARELLVPVGESDRGSLDWAPNLEAGHQTNGNTRITGQPGMGKSQFLLHLLASAAVRAPDVGFLLLDYKGDLATEEGFVEATGASVIRPERQAIPVNPFDVPATMDLRLVPAAIAETVASLGRGIGDVQRMLLRDGIARAYVAARSEGRANPSSSDIAASVRAVYDEEGRPADSVSSLLQEVADLGLFSTRTEGTPEELLAGRLVVDLSGLQNLRDLVAFVLVGWLARNVVSLPDTPLEGGRWRALRTLVAIDEAHHYLARRCQPLLELLRVGRSKGVPVVLASQSLEDFRRFTELEEFLPTNFVLRQGRVPDARMLQAALRLDAAAGKAAASDAARLEQFMALTTLDPATPGEVVRLHGFFEGRWRP